ncbi:MAG: hypothetical protein P8M80_10085 [Pirellulaceae bacterium]|nr:hypothetical protein [Pirellulaceae bacterium]
MGSPFDRGGGCCAGNCHQGWGMTVVGSLIAGSRIERWVSSLRRADKTPSVIREIGAAEQAAGKPNWDVACRR